MNSAERFRRIDELFRAALRLEPAQRPGFLDTECAEEPEIRAEVEELLSADHAPTGDLDQPALGQEFRLSKIVPPGEKRPRIPERIDRYRVVSKIGEGGMGVVYEAEQDSPRRTVALKVINAGVASAAVLRRFEHEAQVLGKLQHPGIAQVYEAGTFDAGHGPQPFFAMELIRGQPLTRFATVNDLATAERLDLLARIADAVQHAHQRGVIHRDLKPSNILVDESGEPKILDFGVARATDSDIQTTTLRTDVGQLVGTIPYMSPEQAAGDPDELDTRSDVYALGVVAYELLAGRLPYDVRKKVIHEAVRMIREETPPSLSSLNPVLRGDVETIVGKAMEKDKTRRYQSASALAADIRRYLGDEPIAARPPSAWYQFRKFATRNKAVVGAAAVVFVVLLAGVIVTSVFAVREARAKERVEDALALAEERRQEADEARKVAEVSRDESDAVVTFLSDMLAAADPSEQGRDVSVREVVDEAADQIGAEFADRPQIEARLRHTMAVTYRTLGLYDQAEREAERAFRLREEALGPLHPDTLEAKKNLGMVYWRQGRNDDAEAIYEENLAELRRLHGDEHPDTLNTRNLLANVYLERGQWDRAEQEFSAIAPLSARVVGPEDRKTLLIQNNLGLVYMRQARLDEAESIYRRTLETQQRVLGEDHPDTLISFMNLGSIYLGRGDYDSAEKHLVEALGPLTRVYGAQHPHTLTARQNLAAIWMERGEHAKAEESLLELLEIRKRVSGPQHPNTLMVLTVLGYVYRNSGQYEKAEPILTETLEASRALVGPEHPNTLATVSALIDVYRRTGDLDKGEPLALEAIEIMERAFGPAYTTTLSTMWSLARLYQDNRRYEDAENVFATILQRRRESQGDDDPATINAMAHLADVYEDLDRDEKAEALYREAVERSIEVRGPEDKDTLWTMNELAVLLRNARRFDEAGPLYEETLAGRRRVLGPDDSSTLTTLSGFARMHRFAGDYSQAEALWLETLEARRRTLGLEHKDTRKTLRDLIELYSVQERFEDTGPLLAELAAAPISDAGEMNDVAWTLLTCEPPSLRNPARALELSMACNELTGYRDPNHLDTLALALHQQGRTEEAAQRQRQAIDLIPPSDEARRESFQRTLATYEQALPAGGP